jgi:hypothetical protein
MKRIVVLLLAFSCIAPSPLLQASGPGGHAHYVGGTVAELPSKTEGLIQTTDPGAMLFAAKAVTIRVPYGDITNIEYGQRVERRYMEAILISPLMLLSKKRSHFLTVGYTDGQGRQQAMVFQVSGNDVRSVLVSLEARTGRKVEFQDEEARKAGKG